MMQRPNEPSEHAIMQGVMYHDQLQDVVNTQSIPSVDDVRQLNDVPLLRQYDMLRDVIVKSTTMKRHMNQDMLMLQERILFHRNMVLQHQRCIAYYEQAIETASSNTKTNTQKLNQKLRDQVVRFNDQYKNTHRQTQQPINQDTLILPSAHPEQQHNTFALFEALSPANIECGFAGGSSSPLLGTNFDPTTITGGDEFSFSFDDATFWSTNDSTTAPAECSPSINSITVVTQQEPEPEPTSAPQPNPIVPQVPVDIATARDDMDVPTDIRQGRISTLKDVPTTPLPPVLQYDPDMPVQVVGFAPRDATKVSIPAKERTILISDGEYDQLQSVFPLKFQFLIIGRSDDQKYVFRLRVRDAYKDEQGETQFITQLISAGPHCYSGGKGIIFRSVRDAFTELTTLCSGVTPKETSRTLSSMHDRFIIDGGGVPKSHPLQLCILKKMSLQFVTTVLPDRLVERRKPISSVFVPFPLKPIQQWLQDAQRTRPWNVVRV